MDTKKIILGAAVILVLAVLLSVYGLKNWEKGIGGKNAELSATITLPNGTVQKITGISGFPAGGSGSPSDRPPSPPG